MSNYSCVKLASKFGVSISTILDYLRRINNVKKLDRWVSHEINAHQIKNVSMFAFLCFRGIKAAFSASCRYL